MSLRGICSSQGTFLDGDTSLKTEGSQDNRLAVLVERLEKKEQEKEREKENILRLTRQSRRRPTREDGFRMQPKQQQVVEEEKMDKRKPPRDLISETDLKKIAMYFRYKVYSLVKIVEDKVNNTSSLLKSAKGTKVRLGSLISATPTISTATSPVMTRMSMDNVVPDVSRDIIYAVNVSLGGKYD